MTMNKKLGLYLHLPFCLSKCGYCDFCSFPAVTEKGMAEYTEALLQEVRHHAQAAKDRRVDTVFFGGGTPTLLPLPLFERIFETLHSLYSIEKDAEITLEANPASISKEKLASLRSMGFNRLSMGAQSFQNEELLRLGRAHTAEEAAAFYQDVRDGGFSNVNIDLMYAIPSQTAESFEKSLSTAIALAPEHLSVYSLIVEDGTPFYQKRDSLDLPSEEEEEKMRCLLLKKTRAAGYERYEISNFAKSGYACRHNLHYWRNEEYLGFGLAAYSYFGGDRYGNGRNMQEYLQAPTGAVAEKETLSVQDAAYEYVMTHLRLSEGFSLAEYKAAFGIDFLALHALRLQEYKALGLLKTENGRIFLTDEGMNLSNSILVSFM